MIKKNGTNNPVWIHASDTCFYDRPHWTIGTDHFDKGEYTIDAVLEPFIGPEKVTLSAYYDGKFGIKLPDGLWAMITENEDGQGDFRLLKGQTGACQTLDEDFVNKVFRYGRPALVLL